MMREHFGAQHAGMMEGRLDALKSELKLTPDQVRAWEKFENTATKQRAAMKEVHSAARSTPQSAPERMALHIELMEQRLAGMQEMSAALNGLYDVLTPAQKTIIDQGVGPMAGRHAAHLASHR
jgi:hypothetical protein